MATYTTNLNLRKPGSNDNVNVSTDINDNMNIIDSAYGTLNSKFILTGTSRVGFNNSGNISMITMEDGINFGIEKSGSDYYLEVFTNQGGVLAYLKLTNT